MTAPEITQLITAVTALIGASASIIAMVRIQIVKKQTNSLVTRLLIEGKDAARAEGRQQERDQPSRPEP